MNPKIFGQQTIVQDEQYNLHPQLRQIHDMMRNAKCIFGDYGFVNPSIFNNSIIGPFLKYRNRQCPHYNLTWCTPWLVSGPSIEATHLFRMEQSNLWAWGFGWIIDLLTPGSTRSGFPTREKDFCRSGSHSPLQWSNPSP